jgi:hypothetical protein
MLWARKLRPVPGVSHPPFKPLKPSVTAYITWWFVFKVVWLVYWLQVFLQGKPTDTTANRQPKRNNRQPPRPAP